jgi:hypothetical protein
MHIIKEVVSKEEDYFGVIHNGRRYKRWNIGADKGEMSLREENHAISSIL